MTEDKSYLPAKYKHPIPIPYPVIALVWVVALIASNRFLHEINFFLWLAGPVIALVKLHFDAEAIGMIKDHPEPKEYNFHAPGVWAQLEQTIKTLPGSFKNVSVNITYQILHPPKGMPMQLDAIITLRHPEVSKDAVDPSKQNDMKSTLVLHATIMPAGNKSVLTLTFNADPLIGRQPLDAIITHICQQVDLLVSQHIK